MEYVFFPFSFERRMMKTSFFRILNSSAMRSGLYAGFFSIIGFVCFCHSFDYVFCNYVFVILATLIPFFVGFFTCKFRKTYLTDGAQVYSKLYLYSLMTYFYSGILLSAAVYIYFLYFDKGAFFNSYLTFLERPDVKALLNKSFAAGSEMNVETLIESVEKLSHVNVSIYALSAFYMNMMFGAFASILIALVCFIIKK